MGRGARRAHAIRERQAFRGSRRWPSIFSARSTRCARDVHERHGLRRAGRRMSHQGVRAERILQLSVHPVQEDAECPADSAGCVAYGVCEGDASLACFSLGAGGCGAQGACNAPVAECLNFTSLRRAAYAAPAVAIAALPGNEPALRTSLQAERRSASRPRPLPSPARCRPRSSARAASRNTA